ncbi:MAG: hypothetical protein RLZZ611_1489 [Cyanobacteriota bacterium]
MPILFRTQRHGSRATPADRRSPDQRRRWMLLAGLAGLALSGCSSGASLPTPSVVYLAIGANADQTVDTNLREDYQGRLALMQAGFQQLHPGTTFQLGIYPDRQMQAAIQRRSHAGLAPDLLIISGDLALQLLEAGLVDPFPADAALQNQFDPDVLNRLRSPDGRLAGLPLLVQTQLACFDRRRLPEAPRTLAELLEVSAAGQAIGLAVDPVNLLWSAGSLGAIPALEQLARRRPLSPEQEQSLEQWLAWLQNASDQQRVTFFGSQQTTDAEFMAGRLAWIPCRSTMLPQMRRRLGEALAVAPLPDGPDHRASPVNRLRVMALGRNSSGAGRQRAVAFSRFGANPLTQRALTLGSHTVLPANRFVAVPVQSSQVLRSMQEAADQGLQANELIALLHSDRNRPARLRNLLIQLVYGELSARAARQKLVQILAATP